MLTYRQKHEQANKEALATVIALVVTIAVWCLCGFGLAGLDVQVFHTPLWVVGGTIGTWACSIVVVAVLAKKVFVGFDLDEDDVAAVRAAADGKNGAPVGFDSGAGALGAATQTAAGAKGAAHE